MNAEAARVHLRDAGICNRVGAVGRARFRGDNTGRRSEEHTSELQSLMRISYAVFCLKKKNTNNNINQKTSRLRHIIRRILSINTQLRNAIQLITRSQCNYDKLHTNLMT